MPKNGELTRNFDLSVQARGGSKGHATMDVYVLDPGNIIRPIAQGVFKLSREWKTRTVSFTVPVGYDQFGISFYLPRDEVLMWLDDVRLTPSLKARP